MLPVFGAFAAAGFRIVRGDNLGCMFSLRPALAQIEPCELVCYLDDDLLVARNFVYTLTTVFLRIQDDLGVAPKDVLLTGFNCDRCQHISILPRGDGYTARKSIGGASLVFPYA